MCPEGLLLEPLVARVLGAAPGDALGVLDAAVGAEGLSAKEPQAQVGGGDAVKRQPVGWSSLEIGAELVVQVEGVGNIGTGPQCGVAHLRTMQLATQVVGGGVIFGFLAQQLMSEAESPAGRLHHNSILLDEKDVLEVVPCAVFGLGVGGDAQHHLVVTAALPEVLAHAGQQQAVGRYDEFDIGQDAACQLDGVTHLRVQQGLTAHEVHLVNTDFC